jgi:hypothetical protein
MVQFQLAGWASFGVHIDWRRRRHARSGLEYGPYADLHLGPAIFSIGRNCWLAIDHDMQSGRGGLAV